VVEVVGGSPDGDRAGHAYLSELFGHEDQESNHDRVPVVCEPHEGPVDQCTQQLEMVKGSTEVEENVEGHGALAWVDAGVVVGQHGRGGCT